MKNAFMNDLEVDKAVKIQGTKFDRKRVLDDQDINYIKLMHKEGVSISQLAKMFQVNWRTIKYNIDDDYRKLMLSKVSGVHTGITRCGFADRVAYKRSLISK